MISPLEHILNTKKRDAQKEGQKFTGKINDGEWSTDKLDGENTAIYGSRYQSRPLLWYKKNTIANRHITCYSIVSAAVTVPFNVVLNDGLRQ